MQTSQVYQSPIVEVSSPNSIIKDPPKEYRAEGSYFDGKTPGTADLPSPYNMDGDEKKWRKGLPFPPNTHRRYSKQWFGHAYDAAVRVGKWPRIIYSVVGLVLVGAWVAVMFVSLHFNPQHA
jgi:hypothetical protein